MSPLRSILPNLLQAGLFEYKWLVTEIVAEPDTVTSSAANIEGGSAKPDYIIQGQFLQTGDKTRVDVSVRDGSNGSIVKTENTSCDLSTMMTNKNTLAKQVAKAISPSAVHDAAEQAAFTATLRLVFNGAGTNKNLAYLQTSLPNAIEHGIVS